MKKILIILLLFFVLFLPRTVFAHEVYVLTDSQIDTDLHMHSLNVFSSLNSVANLLWFLFFAACAIISLSISFVISFSRWGIAVAKKIKRFDKFALPIIRVVFGISLIYSAHYTSLFGPELSLAHMPGANLLGIALYAAGILVIVGLFTQFVTIVLLCIFLLAIVSFHEYMLTYVNYLGEMLVLLLIGGDAYSLDRLFFKKFQAFRIKNAPLLAISILRISFALSLLYAALYVKFLHPALSYQVVIQYHLTKFFPFDPLFIVLGAGCIEVVIALLFLFGVNMRWNILFFAFWATLSLLFFGESVWPHYILFGICIGLFLYGYDQYTLESWLAKQTKKYIKT
ncbi:MAG TPA: DoxX family protein [Candidatus Saccharimonadales bacterium]|nr:DoxX family protein [Candidatus Saccharimonadales bacterium]